MKLKVWGKIALWFGFGGTVGTFIGYRIGNKASQKSAKAIYDAGYRDGKNSVLAEDSEESEDFDTAMSEYSGGMYDDTDGDELTPMDGQSQPVPDEVPGDIPSLHPEQMRQQIITEDEYYQDRWQYEQHELLYYSEDKVLFDKTTQQVIEGQGEQDDLIGIGTLSEFYTKPDGGPATDTIFVKNDTFSALFRIDFMDAAYDDPVSGGNAPDYEVDDDEDID